MYIIFWSEPSMVAKEDKPNHHLEDNVHLDTNSWGNIKGKIFSTQCLSPTVKSYISTNQGKLKRSAEAVQKSMKRGKLHIRGSIVFLLEHTTKIYANIMLHFKDFKRFCINKLIFTMCTFYALLEESLFTLCSHCTFSLPILLEQIGKCEFIGLSERTLSLMCMYPAGFDFF